jgi:hypothetical protein
MIVSRLTVKELRKRLKLAGFRGSVRALAALGPIPNADILCAALFCSRHAPHEVFINTRVHCDHHHLTVDVMNLVNAFQNGHVDHGWDRKSNGDASTAILTREAAADAGIPSNQWAANPYRTSG